MARLEYLDDESHPELADLVGRIRGARGSRLINLYRLLLHSPPIAEGWLELGGALRYQGVLDGLARELAIVRVAVLTDADYEYQAHVRYARNEGATVEQIEAVAEWESATIFDDRLRAVFAYTDALTREVRASDEVFGALKEYFDDRQILELTVNIGFYNMVSRVLEAMQIDVEPDPPRLDQDA